MTAAATAAGRKPRRRTADLMIADTSIAEDLPLFTANPADFASLDALLRIIPVTRPDVPHEQSRSRSRRLPAGHQDPLAHETKPGNETSREDGAKNRRPARGAIARVPLASGCAYLAHQPAAPTLTVADDRTLRTRLLIRHLALRKKVAAVVNSARHPYQRHAERCRFRAQGPMPLSQQWSAWRRWAPAPGPGRTGRSSIPFAPSALAAAASRPAGEDSGSLGPL